MRIDYRTPLPIALGCFFTNTCPTINKGGDLALEDPLLLVMNVRYPECPAIFGIGRSISILNNGSIKWPTHIFTKWPFCMGDLQNTLRR